MSTETAITNTNYEITRQLSHDTTVDDLGDIARSASHQISRTRCVIRQKLL